jgi:uncharacterized protein YkwD
MALFGIKKKKQAPEPAVPETTPTEEVLRLRQQGLSNNQIVQSLQRSGYKTHQIFDAMNQADMRSAAPVDIGPEQAAMEPLQPPQQLQSPQPPLPQETPQTYAEQQPEPVQQATEEKIEEIAESIIDEKWQELVKNVNKIVEWKNAMEAKITSLEEQQASLKEDFESLHKALFERMEKYDKNVANVGTNLQAMEQVFKKILPTLTANVNELSRITKGMKGKKSK